MYYVDRSQPESDDKPSRMASDVAKSVICSIGSDVVNRTVRLHPALAVPTQDWQATNISMNSGETIGGSAFRAANEVLENASPSIIGGSIAGRQMQSQAEDAIFTFIDAATVVRDVVLPTSSMAIEVAWSVAASVSTEDVQMSVQQTVIVTLSDNTRVTFGTIVTDTTHNLD